MKNSFLIAAFLALVFTNACKNNDWVVDPNYPTTIEQLNTVEIDQIINVLEQTPMANCQSVDVFGFPFINLDNDLCIDAENWRYHSTKTALSDSTKKAIFTYGQLLNVSDTAGIQILSTLTPDDVTYDKFYAVKTDSAPPVWILTTQQQRYNNLTVRGTYLSVILAPDHIVGISGHWFDFIYIPNEDNFSDTEAQESLYNRTFDYNNRDITPNSEMTWHETRKVIMPVRRSNKIELRVCWALYPSTWEIIVDTQTGEVITKVDISYL